MTTTNDPQKERRAKISQHFQQNGLRWSICWCDLKLVSMVRFLLLQIPLWWSHPSCFYPRGSHKKTLAAWLRQACSQIRGFYCRTERRQEENCNILFFQSCALCGGVVRECRWRRLAGGARHVIFHTAVNTQLAFYFHRESFHHVPASVSFSFC